MKTLLFKNLVLLMNSSSRRVKNRLKALRVRMAKKRILEQFSRVQGMKNADRRKNAEEIWIEL